MKSIDLKDKTLVDIDDDTMTFELDVEINFSAGVSYDSLEFAIFDREDDRYYNVERLEEEVHQTITLSFEAHLSYFINSSDDLLLDEIVDIYSSSHNSINTIEINPEYYDDY